jgi:hypothetical protein
VAVVVGVEAEGERWAAVSAWVLEERSGEERRAVNGHRPSSMRAPKNVQRSASTGGRERLKQSASSRQHQRMLQYGLEKKG